jgi:hypothetical protein
MTHGTISRITAWQLNYGPWHVPSQLGFIAFWKPILKNRFLDKCEKYENRFLKFKKPILDTVEPQTDTAGEFQFCPL